MTKRRTEKRKPGKWIYKPTRQAIYLRDNHTCYWCGATEKDGAQLSLDHLVPWVYFGADNHRNLVTCCRKCNSKRGDKKLKQWYQVLEDEYGKDLEEIQVIQERIKKVRRSSDSSIQKFRDIVNGKKPYCKLAPGHSLAK
tara:strand:- start:297 stop:716 length:420 start_codon:yes stop_codon:yes gene_type:complete